MYKLHDGADVGVGVGVDVAVGVGVSVGVGVGVGVMRNAPSTVKIAPAAGIDT